MCFAIPNMEYYTKGLRIIFHLNKWMFQYMDQKIKILMEVYIKHFFKKYDDMRNKIKYHS